jgi:hypothetical protein
MNKTIPALVIGVLLGAGGAWLFLMPGRAVPERKEEAEEAKEKEPRPVAITRTATGVIQLTLNAETQARIGLQTQPVAATNLAPEYRAFGRVLDPVALSQQLIEIQSATAALQVSRREQERIQTLFQQNQNASARALENAGLAVQRDRALADAAHLRLVTTWGSSLIERPGLDQLVTLLQRRSALLIRLDLPIGSALPGPPDTAAVAGLATDAPRFPAEILGPVPTADPSAQGPGYLVLIQTNAFAPGAAVLGWITSQASDSAHLDSNAKTNSPAQPGVILPRSAVVRHLGDSFAYAQVTTNTFERLPVSIRMPVAEGYFVSDGLAPGRRVVVVGAQLLLSEELKGAGGEE